MPTNVAVVRGRDGKLLGIVYDGDQVISRASFQSFESFLEACSWVLISRAPCDSESPNAKALIAEDDKRLNDLCVKIDGSIEDTTVKGDSYGNV